MRSPARSGADDWHAAIVVGAGPAGLAASRELARAGVDHVVLERGARVGHTWEHLYDGLVLHTGKHLSSLPGLSFPASTPLFPTRRDFLDYLARYAQTFRLPVRTNADVVSLRRSGDSWIARTAAGDEPHARAVVMATGIVSNPQRPDIPGLDRFGGTVMHSVEYRRPERFAGLRTLVVGAGNSAGEIAVEIANAGGRVTLAVRSGARVVPRDLFGVPIQYIAAALIRLPARAQRGISELVARASELARGPAVLPRPAQTRCSGIPLIGFHLVDAIRAGTIAVIGGITRFTAEGACFANGFEEPFDTVILATGYKPALATLGDQIRLDDCGFARRRGRVTSRDQPGLYFIGHNYDLRGALRNIAIDAGKLKRVLEF